MSVHHEISKKVNKTVSIVETYKKLDQKREVEIEKIIEKERRGEAYNLEAVNKITEELNQFAKLHHLPTRKIVSNQMVKDFLNQI